MAVPSPPKPFPTESSRTTTRPLPREQRRQAILIGAARAFAAAGFDGTSMEDIANASGVTKLILYRHFDSKENLYLSIVQQVAGRLAAAVPAAIEGGAPRELIVSAFLKVARDDPDGFYLLWRHSYREPKFARHAEGVQHSAVAFARNLLETRIPDGAVLDWAAPMIVSFLVESVLNWLDMGDLQADDHFIDLTIRSLTALIGTWSADARSPRS